VGALERERTLFSLKGSGEAVRQQRKTIYQVHNILFFSVG
jgi:hypothetical protein